MNLTNWPENWKLLQTHTYACSLKYCLIVRHQIRFYRLRMFSIVVLIVSSTFQCPLLLTSYFFVFLSPSSYSHLYICRWLGVHFKEKISNNALMCVWVCLNLACILLLPHCSCTCSYACISMHSYQHATFGFFKSQTMKIQVQMDVVCCGIYD